MSYIRGGSFLLGKTNPEDVFIPEEMDELHKMVKQTMQDFCQDKVLAREEEIEEKQEGVMASLIKEAGGLGLLGSEIEEEYGGDETDKITSIIISENSSYNGSFDVTFGGQVGIGTLPIVYFGNQDQKKRYLPGLVSGEKLSAYALTEPEAGTDAMNCQTRAELSQDGKYYILNGTKQFITTAAWADVIVTYAKIDGEKFTAFIIDGDAEGLSIGPEEKKMGLKGTSTCSINLDDCKVPVENVLHEIGKGHHVALNTLNMGRFKLSAVCTGGGKRAIEIATDYALQRYQFKQPIAEFNLTKEKVAEMVIYTYAMESMVYRTAGLMEERMSEANEEEISEAIREYALEYSINKVFCSEAHDYIVDMAMQIFGGYGYCQEYPVERMYRDSRVKRIFEGTNEINRIVVPGTLLGKGKNGELPLAETISSLESAIEEARGKEVPTKPLEREEFIVDNMKSLFLMALGKADEVYGKELRKEQEIQERLADMAAQIYASESALIRARKIKENQGEEAAKFPVMITESLTIKAIKQVSDWCREILAATVEEEELKKLNQSIDILARFEQLNLFSRQRQIADQAYRVKKYLLDY